MSPRRFVIPDIHGCSRTFRRLLEEVIRLSPSDSLYLLGDMIDRGPGSREVLDTVLHLQANGYRITPLRGNHEEMLLLSCRDRSYFRLWMINGGHATLESFGIEDGCDIPLPYRRFLESLPFYVQLDDFILVHGSLNFLDPDPLGDTEAMLWSRDPLVERERIGGRRVIGGHTPVGLDDIRSSLKGDKIMLDNGCVYSGIPGLGSLTALNLDTMTLHIQPNCEAEQSVL